jgi:hypothetical protein
LADGATGGIRVAFQDQGFAPGTGVRVEAPPFSAGADGPRVCQTLNLTAHIAVYWREFKWQAKQSQENSGWKFRSMPLASRTSSRHKL